MTNNATDERNSHSADNIIGDSSRNSAPDAAAVTLAEIMNPNVITAAPDEPVWTAAQKMSDNDVSCLVVTQNDNIIGIVTHYDFIRKVLGKNTQNNEMTVDQIMSGPVATLPDSASPVEAGRTMDDKKVKHLPVVSAGKLVGIVTQTDLFHAAHDALQQQLKQLHEHGSRAQAQLENAYRKPEAAAEKTGSDARYSIVADLAKNNFLASISHEIRTPLNAIIGLSEVLVEEQLTEEQQSHLQIISESAQNMLVLINDILDYSKIEAGQFSLDISQCSLEHLLAVLESSTRPQAIQKNLEFTISQKTNLPVTIKTDPVRLRQCLTNLIGNAVDFTEKGYVRVLVSLENHNGTDCIRFDVEDTGVGIAEQDQQRIFQEFPQAATVSERRSAGTGLGLAIAKKLVHLLGGEICLKSKIGQGSTFSIIIPAGLDVNTQPVFNKNDQLKRIRKEKSVSKGAMLSGKVLVAEDTPTNQTLIKLLLAKLGLQSAIAEDGKQAVEMALKEDFDMVLMDIQMPHMNGYDATKRLRQAGFIKPIIAVTAHAMRGDKEKCLAAGCDDYISKPINRKQLVDVLRTYLKPQDGDLAQQIDAAADQLEQLSQLSDQADTDDRQSSDYSDSPQQLEPSGEDFAAHDLIDFKAVSEICDDPQVIKEVAQMFLKDSPRCIKSMAEAIKSANPKHIRMYAHSLKGAALQIGAKKLADIAYQLECAGRDKNMRDVPLLFSTVQDEYSRLTLFLSQPNWLDLAKNADN